MDKGTEKNIIIFYFLVLYAGNQALLKLDCYHRILSDNDG